MPMIPYTGGGDGYDPVELFKWKMAHEAQQAEQQMQRAMALEQYRSGGNMREAEYKAALEQQKLQEARTWEQQQAQQRMGYVEGLMGTKGTPRQMQSIPYEMEGPLPQAQQEQEYANQALQQQNPEAWAAAQRSGAPTLRPVSMVQQQVAPEVPGTGYLGGQLSPIELATRLMALPDKDMAAKAMGLLTSEATTPEKRKEMEYFLGLSPEKRRELSESGLVGGKGQLPVDLQVERENILEQAKVAREWVHGFTNTESLRKTADDLSQIQRAKTLLQSPGTTGKLHELLLPYKQWADSIGIDIAGVQDQEQLQSIFGDYVLARVGDSKGAISDMEMRLFTEYSPNMGKTKEGNMALLEYQEKRLQRDQRLQRMAREMQRQGKSPVQVKTAVDDFLQNPANDLSADLRKSIKVPAAGPQAGPSAADAELLKKYGVK